MGTVTFDISMSLDGYISAADPTPEEPMGVGGERLHEWALGADDRGATLLADALERLGASIAGRVTYDESLPWWGADGPTGPARRPLFVVTHQPPDEAPRRGRVRVRHRRDRERARAAQAAAGERDVTVMGGAELGRQYIAAGLVDEISIHLVPVLFGGGKRMFDGSLGDQIALEPVEAIETPLAIHQRFRVLGRRGLTN